VWVKGGGVVLIRVRSRDPVGQRGEVLYSLG
jgi:hypothetical protein